MVRGLSAMAADGDAQSLWLHRLPPSGQGLAGSLGTSIS